VSQISPPVRILLIGAVVFLAAWFTVLRPKPAAIEPVTTPTTTTTTPATGPGKAVDAAKTAAAEASAAAKARAGETQSTPGTATAPATTTTAPTAKAETPSPIAIPADTLAKLPKTVAAALETRKVLVLAVFGDEATRWRPLADDDRFVRNALRDVNRYDGQVLVKQIPAGKLSGYGPLVNGLDVNQTPSIVVIDRDLKGKVLTGYVDRVAINQAIADARRDSIEPDIKDSYLRQANEICGHFETRISRWSHPTARGKKPLKASYARRLGIIRTYRRQIAATAAPAEYRSMKKLWLRVMTVGERNAAVLAKTGKVGKLKYSPRDAAALDRMFNEAGVTDCASNRRS
jgi:hypothetical protein